MNCKNKCCTIQVQKYTVDDSNYIYTKFRKKKAGIFFYDKDQDKILLVLSRNECWGFPKGTQEDNETIKECAIREVKEETGITISNDSLSNYTRISNCTYFCLDYPEIEVQVQSHIPNNDANGITWIRLGCLVDLVKNKQMKINSHCKQLLKRKFNIDLFH